MASSSGQFSSRLHEGYQRAHVTSGHDNIQSHRGSMSSEVFLLGAPSVLPLRRPPLLVSLIRTRSWVTPQPGAMGETVWAQRLLGGHLPHWKGVTA